MARFPSKSDDDLMSINVAKFLVKIRFVLMKRDLLMDFDNLRGRSRTSQLKDHEERMDARRVNNTSPVLLQQEFMTRGPAEIEVQQTFPL